MRPGDGVLMLSPVYAPYTHFVEDRQLRLHSVSVDPLTGAADDASLQQALESPERIKAIVLITPNNPTGFPVPPATLQKTGRNCRKAQRHRPFRRSIWRIFSLAQGARCRCPRCVGAPFGSTPSQK